MNIEDMFRNLSYGVFSNLALGVEGSGTIREEDQPRIIHFANEALLRLYTRFVLCEKDVVIEQVEHIQFYHLKKRFAESNWNPDEEKYPYIKDLGREPFIEDVVKILEVYDSNGVLLPLNDNEQPHSLFTPQAHVLQVARPMDRVALAVLYQAKHPKLVLEESEEQEINLPDVLHAALYAHIAAQVFSGIATQESLQKASEQMAVYESICQDAVEHDLVSTSVSTTNQRFHKRGWI